VTGPGTNPGGTPVFSARFRVVAKDVLGQEGDDASDAGFSIFAPVTSGDQEAPLAFGLAPPWPNPAGGAAHLEYTVARTSPVRLSVLDVQGREVAVLAHGLHAPGHYGVSWAGAGRGRAAAGLYFVRFETLEGVFVRRLVVAR